MELRLGEKKRILESRVRELSDFGEIKRVCFVPGKKEDNR